jgi:hypothetical protein
MNGIIHLPFVLSLAKDMVQRFPVRDGARAWLTGHQAHGCHIPCLYTRATRAAPNRIASANSATPAVGQSRKRHSTRSIQSLPARPARATPAPSTTRSPLGTRGQGCSETAQGQNQRDAEHDRPERGPQRLRIETVEYQKAKRPFQEGATAYPPMEVGTSGPLPPELPLHSVIAHRHSLPASAMSAPFQAGGQPVSCHVLPGNSILG